MIFLYIWGAFAGLIALLFFGKLIAQAALAAKGKSTSWASYNAMLLTMCMIAFFPIMVLVACVKSTK